MGHAFYDGLRAIEEDPFKVALLVRLTLNHIFFKRLEDIDDHSIAAGENVDLQDMFLLQEALPHSRAPYRTAHDVITALQNEGSASFANWDIGYDVELLPSATGGAPLAFVLSGNKREYIDALIETNVFID